MHSGNIVGFEKLPKDTQKLLNKLGDQIEALVPIRDKEIHEEVVQFLVGINPENYPDGDLPARHLAACLVTYFKVSPRDGV